MRQCAAINASVNGDSVINVDTTTPHNHNAAYQYPYIVFMCIFLLYLFYISLSATFYIKFCIVQ